jgi:glycosyltransferase involved in cell wall biosynthesis
MVLRMTEEIDGPLNILHVFRAPVGGLFRHVVDLARGQIQRGHRVGLIADSTTGGERAERALAEFGDSLALGISRIAVRRHLGPGDLAGVFHVSRRIAETGAHVVHGHGAKGGAYARLAPGTNKAIRVYTPHGGSLLYRPNALLGALYLSLENILMRRGDLFLFESTYSSDVFRAKVGKPQGFVRVVHNGIGAADFESVAPAPDATDLVFVGEFRPVKGIDILIEAIASLHQTGRRISATIVGHGPEEAALRGQAARLGLAGHIHFTSAMPARRAFSLGRLMVVPSRSESLPYIVLEAAGAGIPLVSTRVGGIPEIFGPQSSCLISPESPEALAAAIAAALDDPAAMQDAARSLRERVRAHFSAESMVDGVLHSYRQALRSV